MSYEHLRSYGDIVLRSRLVKGVPESDLYCTNKNCSWEMRIGFVGPTEDVDAHALERIKAHSAECHG